MDSKLTPTCSLVGSRLHFLYVDLWPHPLIHLAAATSGVLSTGGQPTEAPQGSPLDDPQPDHPLHLSHTVSPSLLIPSYYPFSPLPSSQHLSLSEIILCLHVILLFLLCLHLQDDKCHPSLGFCFFLSCSLLSIQVLKQCLEHDRASKNICSENNPLTWDGKSYSFLGSFVQKKIFPIYKFKILISTLTLLFPW